MKYKKLKNSYLKVSSISLGTMTFGEQTDKKESLRILDFAYDNGVNLFDTAKCTLYIQKEKPKEGAKNL